MTEQPYMQCPPYCEVARGTYTVRPAKAGRGLAHWACTLQATYTVRADMPRRVAWLAFLSLLRWRINQHASALVSNPGNIGKPPIATIPVPAVSPPNQSLTGVPLMQALCKSNVTNLMKIFSSALLYDFNVSEGVYLDSKQVSFGATWQFTSDIKTILLNSGLWKKLPENFQDGSNMWATTMRDVEGWRSWWPGGQVLDPTADVIVDFGS